MILLYHHPYGMRFVEVMNRECGVLRFQSKWNEFGDPVMVGVFYLAQI